MAGSQLHQAADKSRIPDPVQFYIYRRRWCAREEEARARASAAPRRSPSFSFLLSPFLRISPARVAVLLLPLPLPWLLVLLLVVPVLAISVVVAAEAMVVVVAALRVGLSRARDIAWKATAER